MSRHKDFHFSCLTWMIVFNSFFFISAIQISDLKVFNAGMDVTDQVFVSGSTDCTFWDTFNKKDLPINLQGKYSIQQPGDIHISVFDTPFKDNDEVEWLYVGASVNWTSPVSESAKYNLEGFMVVMAGEQANKCRVYEVNHSRFINYDLDFSFSREYFTTKKDIFNIRVYSLPPPNEKYRDDTDFYQHIMFNAEGPTKQQYPGDWLPSIIVKSSLDDRKMTVSFGLPPNKENWLLTEFETLLYKITCFRKENYPYKNKTITKERTETDTTAHVYFTDLADDLYKVVVRVRSNGYVNGTCVCRRKDYCDQNCGSSMTGWFDLSGNRHPEARRENYTQQPCDLTTQSPQSTGNTTHEIDFPPENTITPRENTTTEGSASSVNKRNIIIGAALGSIAAVTVLIIIIAIFCFRRKYPRHYAVKKTGSPKFPGPEPPKSVPSKITRKLVYIAATADHKENTVLIDCLSELLKRHCRCDIIDPREADLQQTCENAWVTVNIEKCDCILYIDSMGADKLLDAHLEHSIETDHLHPMFMKALHYIFKSFNSNQDQKLISLAFTSYLTKNRFATLPSMKFHLPNELPKFIRGLHNLNEKSADKFSGELPLNVDCLTLLPEGIALLQAIKDVQKFEKNNASWFDATYSYKASVPKLESKGSSVSSGHSSVLSGILSVSSTDLHSTTLSPSSDISNPVFPNVPDSPDEGIDCFGPDDKGPDFGKASTFTRLDVSDNVQTANCDSSRLDDHSWATVEKMSDIHYGVEQDTDQCPPSQQPIPPCSTSQIDCDNFSVFIHQINDEKWSDDQSSFHQCPTNTELNTKQWQIIPPHSNVKQLPDEDSVSSRLSDMNDNLSFWSKHTNFGIINENETEADKEDIASVESPYSTIIKPPLHCSQLPDNASDALRDLTEEDERVEYRPVEPTTTIKLDECYDSGFVTSLKDDVTV